MKAFRVSKRWRFGLVALYALVILSPFFGLTLTAAPVQAATISSHFQGGHWAFINRMEIGYYDSNNSLTYIAGDNQLDGNFTYSDFVQGKQEDNQGDICNLSIQPAHHTVTDTAGSNALGISQLGQSVSADKLNQLNPLTVTYNTYNAPTPTNTAGGCSPSSQSFTVTAQSLSNFNILFTWQTPNTIMAAFNNVVFTAPTQSAFEGISLPKGGIKGLDPSLKYNEWFAGAPGHCQDFLLLPVTPNANSVGYWENDDTKGGNQSALDTTCQISGDPNTSIDEAGTASLTGFADAQKQPAAPPVTNTTSNACQITGGFGWILCPLIDMAYKIYNGDTGSQNNTGGLKGEAVKILQTGPLDNTTYAGAFAVWGAFRGLANLFFILIFLFIIFSTTLSIGLSNYDIKKVLPKLVIAAVLVQFSWVLMQLAVDITNILGAGITGLIHNALASVHAPAAVGPSDVVNGAGKVLFTLATGVVTIAFALPLIFALFGLILGVLAIFLTLEFRKLLLLILIVLSPLAFIAWVLPNTESMFKTWFKTTSRLLLMYPLIVLIFAMTGIMQSITNNVGTDVWPRILASLLPIAAFYAIPWSFKWAGSAMSTAGGFFVGRASRLSKGAKSSQFAKDLALSRKEKGAFQAHNENLSKPRQYLGRLRAGAGLPGAGSRRRLASTYTAALSARGNDYESDFISRDLNDAQLTDIATAKTGDRKQGIKVDDAAKAKAIDILGRKGSYDDLRIIKDSMEDKNGKMTPGQARIWQSGISKNVGDIVKSAPDIVMGNRAAFSNMTGDKLASFHKSTAAAMMTHLGSPEGSQDVKGILRALQAIQSSPALKGRMDSIGLGTIVNKSSVFNKEIVSPGVNGEQFMHDNVSMSDVNTAAPNEPPKMMTSATFNN